MLTDAHRMCHTGHPSTPFFNLGDAHMESVLSNPKPEGRVNQNVRATEESSKREVLQGCVGTNTMAQGRWAETPRR